QLRPGPDLGRLIAEFATAYELEINEACKCLVALAVTTLDARYYGLVEQMASAIGGKHAYVRASVYIQAALQGAGHATGYSLGTDSERGLFIAQIVRDFLSQRGQELSERSLAA